MHSPTSLHSAKQADAMPSPPKPYRFIPPSAAKQRSSLQEADSVMADIKLQLARYAQGIHWVQKNFLLDEAISALLVTAGPMSLPGDGGSSQASHVVLQMQPDFDVPFPAPESWNQQVLPRSYMLQLPPSGLSALIVTSVSASCRPCSGWLGRGPYVRHDPCQGRCFCCSPAGPLCQSLSLLGSRNPSSWFACTSFVCTLLFCSKLRVLSELACCTAVQENRGCLTEHTVHGGLQAVKGEAGDIVRVFLQTPTGCCHMDITRAVLHRHIQVRPHCRGG